MACHCVLYIAGANPDSWATQRPEVPGQWSGQTAVPIWVGDNCHGWRATQKKGAMLERGGSASLFSLCLPTHSLTDHGAGNHAFG